MTELFLRARKSLALACLDDKGKPKSELTSADLAAVDSDLQFLNAVKAETEIETAITMELLAFAYSQTQPSDLERSLGWIKKLGEWIEDPKHIAARLYVCKLHKEQPLFSTQQQQQQHATWWKECELLLKLLVRI